MSDIERYWNRIAEKANDPRKWYDLNPQQQMMVIQSVNLLIAVLNS